MKNLGLVVIVEEEYTTYAKEHALVPAEVIDMSEEKGHPMVCATCGGDLIYSKVMGEFICFGKEECTFNSKAVREARARE